MKKRLSILALLGLTIATIAFGVDKLIDAPSGDLILDSGNKVIIKKAIEAQVQSPGFIPVGGMVAVMPHVSGSWQPPTTGVVKDGFMRADGATVSDAESPLNGQVLPTMTGNTYARGDSTTGYTSPHAGGANTQASNVSVGDHSDIDIDHGHGFTQPSAHGITQPAFNVPGHYHSNGPGSNAATSIGVTGGTASLTGTTTFASNGHTHPAGDLRGNLKIADATSLYAGFDAVGGFNTNKQIGVNATPGAVLTVTGGLGINGDTSGNSASAAVGINSVAASITGSNTVTGNFGLVSTGSPGNAPFSTSRTTDVALTNNHSGGAVTALGTTNKSISAHSVTNNAVNNEPKYLSVIWVIRVK